MAGILDHQGIFYQQGILSTQQFRDNLLGRNLPPPVNETLTQSGLVSKLDDIGKVINVPIFGTGDENIPVHYNEDERMFGLGTFFRTTQNVSARSHSGAHFCIILLRGHGRDEVLGRTPKLRTGSHYRCCTPHSGGFRGVRSAAGTSGLNLCGHSRR